MKHFHMEAKNATHLFYIMALLELEKEILKKMYLNFAMWNMSNLVKCSNPVKISQLVYNNQQS